MIHNDNIIKNYNKGYSLTGTKMHLARFSPFLAHFLGLKWGIYEWDKIDKMRLIWKIHHPPYVLMLALFDDVSKSMSHLYPYLYKPIFPFVAPYAPNIWPWNLTLIWAYWKYMRFLRIF